MNNPRKLILIAGIAGSIALAQADDRIPVKTADDLPRHTYRIEGKALDVLKDDKKFNPLLDQVLADTLADLAKYDIKDPATLRAYYDFLQMAYSVKGDLGLALDYCEKARALETKDEEKLMRGQALKARIAAIKLAGGEQDPRFDEAFKAELRTNVSALPYAPIKDRLIAVRSQAKILNRDLVESPLSTQLDPIIEANQGKVPGEVATSLITARATLDFGLHVFPLMAEVYGAIIDAHAGAIAAADLWTPRLKSIPATPGRSPS